MHEQVEPLLVPNNPVAKYTSSRKPLQKTASTPRNPEVNRIRSEAEINLPAASSGVSEE
jgi:hypothetical protein